MVQTGKYIQLDEPPQPWYFVPSAQAPQENGALVVDSALPTRSPSLKFARSFARSILPVFGIMTSEHLVQHSYAFGPSRIGTEMAAEFSALGLLLAGMGLYGVIANSVAQRTKEIGIRLGLGADRAVVIRFVLRQRLVLIASGLAIGVCAALSIGGLIHRFVFGVTPRDSATFAAVISLVLLVGLAACYFPSRTAASIDPAVALRTE